MRRPRQSPSWPRPRPGERAGTALGFGEGRPDAGRYQQIAELCIAAGADQALIERWIKIGRERAAAVAAIPYTGLPPGGLLLLLPRPGAPASWARLPGRQLVARAWRETAGQGAKRRGHGETGGATGKQLPRERHT